MIAQEVSFLKSSYYPQCLPSSVRYILACGGDILSKRELADMVGNWHLNEAVPLIAEALHDYPDEQMDFLKCVLGGVAQERNYFARLRDKMADFLVRVGHDLVVNVSGQRLTRFQNFGFEFLDNQYAEEAYRWRLRGEIICFLSYPAFVRLPRVLDSYRNSERPVLVNVSAWGESRYYHIIPAAYSSRMHQSVFAFDEDEYNDLGGKLMAARVSITRLTE